MLTDKIMPPKRKAAIAAATTPATKTTGKGRGRGKAAASAIPATSDQGPTPKKAAGRGRGKKKADEAPAEAEKPSTARQAITTLQASSGTAKKKTAKPDSYFPHSASATVDILLMILKPICFVTIVLLND